jgi:hypothetical protein
VYVPIAGALIPLLLGLRLVFWALGAGRIQRLPFLP